MLLACISKKSGTSKDTLLCFVREFKNTHSNSIIKAAKSTTWRKAALHEARRPAWSGPCPDVSVQRVMGTRSWDWMLSDHHTTQVTAGSLCVSRTREKAGKALNLKSVFLCHTRLKVLTPVRGTWGMEIQQGWALEASPVSHSTSRLYRRATRQIGNVITQLHLLNERRRRDVSTGTAGFGIWCYLH